MCAIFVIIAMLAKLHNRQAKYLSDKVHMILSILFPMLKITPRSSTDFVSDELEVVLKFVKVEQRKEFAKVLAFFANRFCVQHKLSLPQWIYVLPIIHRFNNQEYSMSSKKMNFSWREDHIQFPVSKDLEDARMTDMK